MLLVFFDPPTPPPVVLVLNLNYIMISFQCVLSRYSFLDWEIAFYDVTYNFVLKLISVHGKVMNGILSPYLDAPWVCLILSVLDFGGHRESIMGT